MVRVVLGIGVRSGVGPEELGEAADSALARAGVTATEVATRDHRAAIVGPLAAARGWTLRLFTEAELSAVDTPHTVRMTGAPSVAEAAALLAAGPGAVLILPKLTFPRVTVALARLSCGPAALTVPSGA
jgi:cobalt-precorrin 5A hydrolase